MRTIVFCLFISLLPYEVLGQAPMFDNDTLYIYFNPNTDGVSTEWFVLGNKENRVFDYNYFPLSNGSNFRLDCSDRSLSQVVPQSTLSNYPIRTLEQLKTYINTLTYQQALTYLEKMKRYYIVEILPNGTAEIIPVKLDMRID